MKKVLKVRLHLAQEDIRFARTVERIQKIVLSELTKIAIVHLYSQGYDNEDLVNFELELTNPSIIYEQEKANLWSEKVSLVSDMKDLKMLSQEWMYKNIFNMSDDEWKLEQGKVISDIKLGFRQSQIEDEGNDPVKTGESFGTPHDLASLSQQSGDDRTNLHKRVVHLKVVMMVLEDLQNQVTTKQMIIHLVETHLVKIQIENELLLITSTRTHHWHMNKKKL